MGSWVKPVLLIIIIITFFCVLPVEASDREEIIFLEDKKGDDYGPGTYEYPRNSDFAPYQGLLDLIQFKLEKTNKDYFFTFTFGEIRNSWDKESGFTHPLIEIYIDNQEGGSTRSFHDAARVKFTSDHPWNKLLKISGEFVRLYTPEDEGKEEDISSTEDIRYTRWDLKDHSLWVENNDIILQLSREKLGNIKEEHLYILVGSFDPFGPGYYRDILPGESSWSISASDYSQDELKNAPRVMDTIIPGEKNQKEILGNFNEQNQAVVFPIQIVEEEETEGMEEEKTSYQLLVLPLLIIFMVIGGFYYFKGPPLLDLDLYQ
ncbi:MAG: glucodextranase DOMON-like domain-containing protein [bacterium]